MIHYPPSSRRYSSEVSICEKYPRKKVLLRPLKDESDGELARSVKLKRISCCGMMGFTKEYGKKQRGMMNHYGARRGLCTSMLNFNTFLETEKER
jgi:hypothetical protein